MIVLRPYQQLAVQRLDDEFRKGNFRTVLWASPGLGKTEISAHMLNRALSHNYPCIFIVRGRNLVNNASDRLSKHGIDHSVFMSGHNKFDGNKMIQICSIDTMSARGKFPFKELKPLIFLDECHKDYSAIFENYPEAYVIGMTGTPFTDMSKYYSYVQPIEPWEAREQGFLVTDKVYCPHIMDTSSVKIIAGDFDKKALASVVTQSAVVGNIVQDWKDLGENRPTVCFATSIEHSLQLKHAFLEAGITAIHCDASSTDEERYEARRLLESGKVKVLCNVDIFSTGWDCPIVSCIILARPTWSLCWYLQAVGRGVRSFPGKSNCVVLDNAGNIFRHGSHFKIREMSLDVPAKKKGRVYETRVTTCLSCYMVFDPTIGDACPDCGWVIPVKSRRVNKVDGKLVEYEEGPIEKKERRASQIIADYRKLEWVRKKNKLKLDWVFIQLFKNYSRDEMVNLSSVTLVPARFLPLPVDPQK